jgi:hypothetical protein
MAKRKSTKEQTMIYKTYKYIFSNFRGGRLVRSPPESAPAIRTIQILRNRGKFDA